MQDEISRKHFSSACISGDRLQTPAAKVAAQIVVEIVLSGMIEYKIFRFKHNSDLS